ncbi:GNAT family N-acetyltransferase [Azotobacter vinelandii]|uniref:GNAT family N-acetyltransferase n=1 Tax=Azotobacter vinelandii TaxID=354 RepID=UPI0007735068|nr:GNAT family N-acetyltransferase [Azotobacter vinelandii]
MDYRFEWTTSLCAPDFPHEAYARLHALVPQATPFNRLGWLRAAERALEAEQRLHVLLAWEGRELRLCLPLVRSRERRLGLRWTILRHLGYPLGDRIALLCQLDENGRRRAREAIHRHLPHALLQLHELAADGEQQTLLEGWAVASSSHEKRTSCRVPVHAIGEDDRREPSGDLRYKLRRARKRAAACDARIRRLSPDGASIGAALETIAAVERASWKGAQGVGIFSGERRRQWMREAFGELAADGLVRIVLLEHGGRCISYRLGLLEHGRLYDYNLAFLPDYAELGSGRLLLDEWIRWGLEEGWRYVDASRVSLRDSSHQLHERMTGAVLQLRWSLYSRRPEGIALGLAYRLWSALKARRRSAMVRASADTGERPCPTE